MLSAALNSWEFGKIPRTECTLFKPFDSPKSIAQSGDRLHALLSAVLPECMESNSFKTELGVIEIARTPHYISVSLDGRTLATVSESRVALLCGDEALFSRVTEVLAESALAWGLDVIVQCEGDDHRAYVEVGNTRVEVSKVDGVTPDLSQFVIMGDGRGSSRETWVVAVDANGQSLHGSKGAISRTQSLVTRWLDEQLNSNAAINELAKHDSHFFLRNVVMSRGRVVGEVQVHVCRRDDQRRIFFEVNFPEDSDVDTPDQVNDEDRDAVAEALDAWKEAATKEARAGGYEVLPAKTKGLCRVGTTVRKRV
jgi:hypothetical protein